MLIKELSIKMGVSEKTIRFFEKVNVLQKHKDFLTVIASMMK
jgi:DNA-binding transcriptional MerR regulator